MSGSAPNQPALPRASSQPAPVTKSVRFEPVSPPSPPSPTKTEESSKRGRRSGDKGTQPYNDDNEQQTSASHSDQPSRRHHHRRASQNDVERSPSPAPSDATVELPPRFDKYGRPKPEKGADLLADTLEEVLSGNGLAGKLFTRFTGALGLDDSDTGGGRSRRR